MSFDSFLGSGFSYPLRLQGGEAKPACAEEKIKQSIYVILMTRRGERVLQPDFGSSIWDYVFELPGESQKALLCGEIVRALARWEHRVDDVQAQVDDSQIAGGKLLISVSYRVRATNRPDNMVFPFYLEEGRW